MWDVLFVISFVINIALLIYFLKPESIVIKEDDPEPEEVTGYVNVDAFMGFPLNGKSHDYKSFFTGKDPRYPFGV